MRRKGVDELLQKPGMVASAMPESFPFDYSSDSAFAESLRAAVHGGVHDRAGLSAQHHLRMCWEGAEFGRQQRIASGLRRAVDQYDDEVRSEAMLFCRHTSGLAINEFLLGLLNDGPTWLDDADPRYADARSFGHSLIASLCQDLGRRDRALLGRLELLVPRSGSAADVLWATLKLEPLGADIGLAIQRLLPLVEDALDFARRLAMSYRRAYLPKLLDVAEALAPFDLAIRQRFLEVATDAQPSMKAELKRRLGV